MKKSAISRMRDIQHFGEEGAVVPAIDVGATSTFMNPEDMDKTFTGELQGCYLYSRHSNPTVNIFGKKMAAMEGSEAAVGLASGMAAISLAVQQTLINENGSHVVSSQTVYGGTYALFKNVFPKIGFRVSFVNTLNLDEVEQAITPQTKVLYAETLSNPLLNLTNIKKLADLAKKYQLKLIIDNTFAPLIIFPIEHGADVVIHSCTKYISGSSDLIAGAICGTSDFINTLIDVNHGLLMLNGSIMDPKIAHELYLRLDHLEPRMKAHSEMALYLAKKMKEAGLKVIYPGLKDYPQYDLFESIFDKSIGHGGLVTLELKNADEAKKMAQKLQDNIFGLYAVSLGFSRTLMSCSAKSTSSEIPKDEQEKMGLSEGLLRLSIGYTGDKDQMWERFKRSL